MNRTPRHIFLPALLAATLAASAAAQQAKPIANWANLNQLVTGAEIRVTLANGRTLRGFTQRVTPESLAINATTSQETLSRQDIRCVALIPVTFGVPFFTPTWKLIRQEALCQWERQHSRPYWACFRPLSLFLERRLSRCAAGIR